MSQRFFWVGVLFEFGLAVTGILLGWTFNVWSFEQLWPTAGSDSSVWGGTTVVEWLGAIGFGVLATLPMVAAGYLAYVKTPRSLHQLKKTADELLMPLFGQYSIVQIAVLSLAAGIGEEFFFRGLMQMGIAKWWGGAIGLTAALVITSLAFGIVHWLHASYAIVATGLGLYLGSLMLVSDGLLAPIVAHALYDFLVLLFLKHRFAHHPPADLNGVQEEPSEAEASLNSESNLESSDSNLDLTERESD